MVSVGIEVHSGFHFLTEWLALVKMLRVCCLKRYSFGRGMMLFG